MKKKNLPKAFAFVVELSIKEDGSKVFLLRSTNGNVFDFSVSKEEFLRSCDSLITDFISTNDESKEID